MLKLQKIAMLGFKSFADNTEIAFTGTGIAAVVGPNGCGKSNLSDAISWVLGEQSPRSLRSSRMQDVIFNGTPNRKPTGMAEVKLTLFDPDAVEQPRPASAEVIAISGEPVSHPKERHQQDDSGIITIARRLFQSGESEYLLNGRACRLRDIHEIFLGTGLGPDSYAIIEQGRIGQLLSAKPYERRALVEEAAGVTKFKAKRKLAWAKLESSKQNLARVSDILEEIRRQLNSLQRQASRARRHSELRSQLRTQTQSLLANQFRLLTEEAARISGEVATLDQSLQESHAQIASQENERQTLRLQLVHEETELRQSVEERSTLRLNAEKARSQVVSQSQQIIFLGNRITEAARELELLSARLADLNAERQQAQVSQDAVQSDIAACNTQLQNHEGQFRAAQDELKQDASRLEQLRMETLEAVHRSATLSNQILQLEQFLSTTERQIDQTRIQCTAVESMRAAANHKCETTRESLEKQRATAQSLANKRMSLEDTLAAGKLEQSYLQVSIEELRSHVSGQRARLSSIEEILNRHAYTSETVQKLFDLHTSKKNSSADASSSAHFEPAGVLADYLEVDPTYEKVVEEFLKEELDYVVVRNWDVASEGVRLLKSEVSGRATFLLDSAIANSTAAPAPMSGVIATLESCLRFTNGFTNSAGHLIPKLRKSYLVSSADAGRALALEHPECYFLAPDGEWLHGGTVTAGRVDSRGPLGLKRELRELARALAAQEEAVAATAQKLASVNSGIASQEADLKVLAQEHQEAEKLLVVAERDLQEATAESQRAAERYSFLALELERLSLEADHARQQREKDALEIHSGEKQKEEIALQVEALRFSLAQREAERESARAQISQIQNQIATLEERRRTAADAFARLHRHCEEVQSKTNELRQSIDEWTRQKNLFTQENQRLELDAAAAEQRAESLALRVTELETICEQRRVKLTEIENLIEQHRLALEQLRERKSTLEIHAARLESDAHHMKETCRVELQIEIEQLLALEIPILTDEELSEAEQSARQLRAKLEALGPINMMALEEYEECRQRHDFLHAQQQDLLASIVDTTKAIEEIDAITNRQFQEAYAQISVHFQETFRQLFGGGQASLRLTEAEDPSEAGIEILAQPPGKRLQNVLLLSGGEKALTSLALLIGIFRFKPAPFCILDEVDAPLDDANIGRFTHMIEQMSEQTQFVIITHSKKTMSIAPVLYGVTMEEPGISKIVSVRFLEQAASASGPVLAMAR